MNKAVVALGSTTCSGRTFKRFVEMIHFLQKNDVITQRTSIVSVYYPSESFNINVNIIVEDEEVSVGHTIAKISNKSKSWIIVTTSAKRKKVRRLLLGSRARQMLALTKRPFLSIRLD